MLLEQAVLHHQAGRLNEAERLYREILATDPRHADALHLLGVLAHQVGRHDIAVELIGQAIGVNPAVASYHANHGIALHALGRYEEAVISHAAAIRLKPDYAEAHSNRGASLKKLGRIEAAIASYRMAVCATPAYVDAQCNLGIALNDHGRFEQAMTAYDTALRVRPDHGPALSGRGLAFYGLGRLDAALACYDSALRVMPNHAYTHSNRGIVLYLLGRIEEAIAAYDVAIRLAPDHADALSNRGPALFDLGRFEEAVASYDAAIRIKPDHAAAFCNRGTALYELGRVEDALASYEAAVRIKPDYAEARSQLIHCLQSVCSWTGLDAHHRELLRQIPASSEKIALFPLLTLGGGAELQHIAARTYAKTLGSPAAPLPKRPFGKGAKIRLGYLSADFRRHPTAHLITDLIESHDRTRFEVTGYSYGPDDSSAERRRLMNAFDRFVDIRDTAHAEAARLIHADGIDILVDLAGYTRGARPQILTWRPAPAQVNFLGYPGTMGADFIDYIIADPICVPAGEDAFYSETVVRLPDSYQPNDQRRKIAAETPSRAAMGLPERGFVFCCFNNGFKITPAIFAAWMRLLAKVPNSVLWLLDSNATAQANLRKEAAIAGIAPERLIFAPHKPVAEHLARYRLADLFLDTLPYNAHTTASDALWAGLPVLTYLGETFAGRVAASLLTAVGLPELITSSLADYEALALALAADPARLASLRQRLAANRDTARLFDTGRYARALETAYERMRDAAQ